MSEGDTAAKTTEHKPDPSRLPACVVGWQAMDVKRLWNDSTRLIVAVPVCSSIPGTMKMSMEEWHYEIDCVVIRCDSENFDIENNAGDSWGWGLEDVDFYVILSE
jgi:hypothetical protein